MKIDDRDVKLLICIQNSKYGLDKIEFQNGNEIKINGIKDEVGIDYTAQIGEEYKLVVTSKNGEKKEEIILIYEINYDFQGGTAEKTNKQVKKKDEDIKLYSEIPIKDGYSFEGWTTKFDSQEIEYNAGEVYKENSNISLYAIWYPLPYFVERPTVYVDTKSSIKIMGEAAVESGTIKEYDYYISTNSDSIGNKLITQTLGEYIYRNMNINTPYYLTMVARTDLEKEVSSRTKVEINIAVYNYGNVGQSTFSVQYTGTHLLEVWGAQGGNGGGNGGYSYGYKSLNQGENLYICVGGQGNNISGTRRGNGGYNGGGNGGNSIGNGYNGGSGGGGATHIAKNNNRGTLNNYASFRSDILIVAGGRWRKMLTSK